MLPCVWERTVRPGCAARYFKGTGKDMIMAIQDEVAEKQKAIQSRQDQ